MSLAFNSSSHSNEAGGPVVGFALTCLAVPAAYAAVGHLLVTHGLSYFRADRSMVFAALCGTPLLLGGLLQWWDVWVRPAPKLGANWSPLRPSQYVGYLFVYHGIVLLVAAYLILEPRPTSPIHPAPSLHASSAPAAPKPASGAPQRKAKAERFQEARGRDLEDVNPFIDDLPGGRLRPITAPTNPFNREPQASTPGPKSTDWKYAGFLFMFAGIVWSLVVPKQSGFSSGQPIQN